ncbi:peptidoglycan DD-metalloendopeptidase family protein [Acidimangrovimonas pyrenivorans]|uniref:Peptidoglycan DD-metalloendopeptidase family protein n=1 Tax=Acidimangrovimonas pyrenivorans TaxID=2030798 RepID=A0ABV7AG45_9RHOB
MTFPRFPLTRPLLLCVALGALTACTDGYDWDLRSAGDGFDTTSAVQKAVARRPQPDDRGIISYPGYQVVIARQGDSVAAVADRIGVNSGELARFNGLTPDAALRGGEVLALPNRVSEPSAATGAAPGQVNITTLAEGAIDRASNGGTPAAESGVVKGQPAKTAAAKAQPADQPLRHKVRRGETAYSIARLYNVPVKALADWNGLGPDLGVREGQYLLIPVAKDGAAPAVPAKVTPPGRPTPAPEPPSAAQPLPADNPTPASKPSPKTPPSPDLGKTRTAASSSTFDMPLNGKIIRGFVKGKSDGIDIGAAAGSPVKAAGDGEVAAITQDVDRVPVIVVRHKDNLLTVYANIDNIKVKKGDKIKRGQTIATVRKGNPSFVHFEVRKGFDSVDPMPYLE